LMMEAHALYRRKLLRSLGLLALAGSGAGHASKASGSIPTGNAQTHLMGQFGPLFSWPVIPIHTVLLPDGRVLAYGSTDTGAQGAALHYALWDPALGTGATAMQLLPNLTGTDIFCAGQALLPSGEVLIVGGDRLVNGVRNYANRQVNLFSPAQNSLNPQAQPMAYQRWYATVVTNALGEQVVLGGRDDRNYSGDANAPATTASYAPTPELRSADGHWRSLSQAVNASAFKAAFADSSAWYYPKAVLAPDGRILTLTPQGQLYALSTQGLGSLSQLPGQLALGHAQLPVAHYLPGRVLTLRQDGSAWTVDARHASPVLRTVASPSALRLHSVLTLLPNGQVWLYGGSTQLNDLASAHYHGELWHPKQTSWTRTASGSRARLYHSVSLLLPDATVLTAGGGAPGPQLNLNAEIYYPPYLYRPDGSGLPATRPVIASGPSYASWGQSGLVLHMLSPHNVAKLSLIRLGAVTHNFNSEQRFSYIAFQQNGAELRFDIPASSTELPPGFYMLFALNSQGVPSVAHMLRLGA